MPPFTTVAGTYPWATILLKSRLRSFWPSTRRFVMDKFIADIGSSSQGKPRRHLSVLRRFHRRRSAAHGCINLRPQLRGCLRRRRLHWRRRCRTPSRMPSVGRGHVWSRRGSFLPGSRCCLLFLGKTRRTRPKWKRHRPRPCSTGHLASPRWVSSIQSLAGLAAPPVPTGSLDWMTSGLPG